uniref:telomere repeats-binding bouquet formation protein 2 isoform X2 n=1 Tax=Oncorhynchus gorbuscha TaxID=8017 RepID=UPI001EAF7550|nr:telomere repeats-binding bouquet formation protein 2 isoform X2 [Oncorhynchus gorbuscha]
MFTNRTAWFSNSVRRGSRWFWVSEGGGITSWETADYLFSEDATCPDTERIFESVDYAENRLTVFHSFYLAACEKCHSVKSVCIGHYVLPPVSVQEVVKAVVGRFIWEQEDNAKAVDTEMTDWHWAIGRRKRNTVEVAVITQTSIVAMPYPFWILRILHKERVLCVVKYNITQLITWLQGMSVLMN